MKKEKRKHTKKFKIYLITSILTLIALISTFAGVWFSYTDSNLSKEMNYEPFYCTWMSNLKNDAKLVDIAIPGSHDAGTNKMMSQAMCQGHDILNQLKGGVRYFDIRVTNNGNDLVIFHGPIKGQLFKNVANDFNTFISAYPSEFMILDFQHLGDNVNSSVINMIKDILPMEKMLPSNLYGDISTIDMNLIRSNKYNFMITWKNKEEAISNNFYVRKDSLTSDYDGDIHRESDEALIKHFDTYYENSSKDKLFVLQAQRTAKTLLGKPSMYEKSFKNKVNKFINNLKNNEVLMRKTNIIMRDFVISDKENINKILSLNTYKNLLK